IITGKFHLQMQPVDLLPILDAAIDTLRLAIDARKIWLRKDFTPTTLMILGDASRLQQVFWNLLSNAVKFTPAGGIIDGSVRLERSHVEVTVRDNGEGINAEFLPFVFDRFRQADGSLNRKHGGLGLGLAIVRHIVELHGGTAQVSSAGLNCGAAFTIRLPL